MNTEDLITTFIISVISYLTGAIPTGFLIAKAKGIDPRKSGSGNIGATNIARTLGTIWFFPVFLLDMSKGFAPVFIPKIVMNAQDYRLIIFAAAAIFGHMTTPFLKFKGGKGVATGFGALLAIDYISALLALTAFLIVLAASRIISISSCAAAATLPILYYFYGTNSDSTILIFLISIGAVVIFKHRGNIVRVINGTEPKITNKS